MKYLTILACMFTSTVASGQGIPVYDATRVVIYENQEAIDQHNARVMQKLNNRLEIGEDLELIKTLEEALKHFAHGDLYRVNRLPNGVRYLVHPNQRVKYLCNFIKQTTANPANAKKVVAQLSAFDYIYPNRCTIGRMYMNCIIQMDRDRIYYVD